MKTKISLFSIIVILFYSIIIWGEELILEGFPINIDITISSIDSAHINHIKTLLNKGEINKAYNYIQNLPDSIKNDPISLNFLGVVYYKKGDYKKSEKLWRKACELAKNTYYLPYYNLGLLYSKRGEYYKAIEFFEKALEIVGDSDKNIIRNLAVLYKYVEDYNKSLIFWKRFLKLKITKEEKIEALREIGYIYYLNGEIKKAKKYLTKAYKINNNDPWVIFYIAVILEKEDPEKAIKYFDKLMEITDYKNEQFLYEYLYFLFYNNYNHKVKEVLTHIDIHNIKSDYLKNLIFDIALKLNKDDILEVYKKELNNILKDSLNVYNYAWFLYKNGEYEKAIYYYKKLLSTSISKAEISLNIAKCFFNLNLLDSALKYANISLNYEVTSEAYFLISSIYLKKKDKNKALLYVKKGLKLEPNNIDFKIIYQILSNQKISGIKNKYRDIIFLYFQRKYKEFLDKSKNLKDDYIYYLRGNVFLDMGFYMQALKEYEKIKNFDKFKYVNIYEKIGNIYFLMGKYNIAKIYYNKEIKVNKNNLSALYSLANIYYIEGNLELSMKLLKSILEKNPNYYKAQALMGNIYLKLNDKYNALKIWKDLFEKYKLKDFTLSRNYAILLYDLGDYNTSLKILKNLKEFYPDSIKLYLDIGNVYFKMGNYKEALKYYNIAEKVYKNEVKRNICIIKRLNNIYDSTCSGVFIESSDSLEFVIQYLDHTKRYNDIIKIYKKNKSILKNNPEALLIIAKAYNSIGEYKKAYDILKYMLKRYPEYKDSIYREMIFSYYLSGQYDNALEVFKQISQKTHIDTINYINILFSLGKYQKVVNIMEKHLTFNEIYEYRQVYLVSLVNLKKYDKVMEFIKKHETLLKDDPIALAVLSWIYYVKNRKEDFILYFQKALDKDSIYIKREFPKLYSLYKKIKEGKIE